jgi:hypothetical protein
VRRHGFDIHSEGKGLSVLPRVQAKTYDVYKTSSASLSCLRRGSLAT